ncbi:MAG: Dihydroorotate dehydrogenase B (NAD(+)), catalytic subunit [Chloroflexi bacterium ADurb.Bin325]|nr:MAG: Dihydroorotate dehydrogenase B (NAD(+)), catalytic subunit [Chloroflexi bacterium ADurb.Bin325]
MSIELAPHNKLGLSLASPLMAGSGALGFGEAWPPGVGPELFAALVTPPITFQPRRGNAPPRLAEIPGGFILATGDHNPGLRRLLRDDAAGWARLGIPALVALAASAPEDWDRLAAALEDQPAVAGLELHLPAQATARDAGLWTANVRRSCQLPLLVKLPAANAELLVEACLHAGADALVAATAPVGAAPALAEETAVVTGPVGGPAALPFTLAALAAVLAQAAGAPVIAAGGITRPADALRCLRMGAAAVQVRSVLWTNPAAVAEIRRAVTEGG